MQYFTIAPMYKTVLLPTGDRVYSYENIIPDGHFTWNEATKGLTRIPKDIVVVKNIYKAAKQMELVRELLGNQPIIINSWYRDPITNKKVGGASHSRHLFGDGIDFRCNHLSPSQIFSRLSNWHNCGGLSTYKSHVHIDFRGYYCRW